VHKLFLTLVLPYWEEQLWCDHTSLYIQCRVHSEGRCRHEGSTQHDLYQKECSM